jgi:hypothetical protein
METMTLLYTGIMFTLILSLIMYSIILNSLYSMSSNDAFTSLPSMVQNLSDIVDGRCPKGNIAPSPAQNYIGLADFNLYTSHVTSYMDSLITISEMCSIILCMMISGLIIVFLFKFYRRGPEINSVFDPYMLANNSMVDHNFYEHMIPADNKLFDFK